MIILMTFYHRYLSNANRENKKPSAMNSQMVSYNQIL